MIIPPPLLIQCWKTIWPDNIPLYRLSNIVCGGRGQWLSCLNNFCMRDSISCKNNEIFDITFCDYFSPFPLFIDETNLTWQYTFVSFVQQCLWGGGGNELVVSIIFVRDCRFNPNHNPNRVNTNPNARINRNPKPLFTCKNYWDNNQTPPPSKQCCKYDIARTSQAGEELRGVEHPPPIICICICKTHKNTRKLRKQFRFVLERPPPLNIDLLSKPLHWRRRWAQFRQHWPRGEPQVKAPILGLTLSQGLTLILTLN